MTGDFNNIPFIKAKHYAPGRKKPCSLVVLHYTAQHTIDETVDFFINENPAKASAHFVIARDIGESKQFPGGLAQMVRLADRAWHAGKSEWQGQKWCNNYSIGLEFVNLGYLKKTDNRFVTWNNKPYPDEYPEPIYAENRYWMPFSEFQYHSGAWLCVKAMHRFKDITQDRIVDHSSVSPDRKLDPGPAFDHNLFMSLINHYKGVKDD